MDTDRLQEHYFSTNAYCLCYTDSVMHYELCRIPGFRTVTVFNYFRFFELLWILVWTQ